MIPLQPLVMLPYHPEFLPPVGNVAPAIYWAAKYQTADDDCLLQSTRILKPYHLLHTGCTLSLVASFWLWCSGVYISSALPATSPTGLIHCLSALFLTPWLINFQDFFKILCWPMPLWVCLCLYLEYPFWHTLFPLGFLYLDSAASVKILCGLPRLA